MKNTVFQSWELLWQALRKAVVQFANAEVQLWPLQQKAGQRPFTGTNLQARSPLRDRFQCISNLLRGLLVVQKVLSKRFFLVSHIGDKTNRAGQASTEVKFFQQIDCPEAAWQVKPPGAIAIFARIRTSTIHEEANSMTEYHNPIFPL